MDEDCVTICSTTTTAMKCCICLDYVTPDKAYKFWECDWHYTCKQCGSSIEDMPTLSRTYWSLCLKTMHS